MRYECCYMKPDCDDEEGFIRESFSADSDIEAAALIANELNGEFKKDYGGKIVDGDGIECDIDDVLDSIEDYMTSDLVNKVYFILNLTTHAIIFNSTRNDLVYSGHWKLDEFEKKDEE